MKWPSISHIAEEILFLRDNQYKTPNSLHRFLFETPVISSPKYDGTPLFIDE